MRRRMGRPGLVGTMARTAVVAGTATAVAGSVSRSQQARAGASQAAAQQQLDAQNAALESQAAMAQMQAQMATLEAQQAMTQQVPAQAAPADDLIGEIERLASLHSSGVLTDEEFAAAKAALLT